MKTDLEQLKNAIDIKDLAIQLGLQVKGRQASCYNKAGHKHGDRHFSLGLDTKTNRYKCFACGEQGSIIDLYKQVKGVELSQAIKELAEMTGLVPNKVEIKQLEASGKPTGAYSEIYEEFCFYCIEQHRKSRGLTQLYLDQESEQYLKGRGLTQETLYRFLLFSVKDYQATDKHLKSKFSLDELQEAGIVSDKGNLIFYRHKIIIPFLQDGRIIFLQGRRLDQEQPKYLHLKRPVPLFNRDTLAEMEKGQKVYITEGVFDAVMLEQQGYKAVAILGVNNFKPEMTELFKRLEVVLCLDNDESGKQGTKALARLFLLNGQMVKTKVLPDGIKDITEYYL